MEEIPTDIENINLNNKLKNAAIPQEIYNSFNDMGYPNSTIEYAFK